MSLRHIIEAAVCGLFVLCGVVIALKKANNTIDRICGGDR